jgi:molecular chaperone GrpE
MNDHDAEPMSLDELAAEADEMELAEEGAFEDIKA